MTDFTRLWFWEFKQDPYDIIVARSPRAARAYRRLVLEGLPEDEFPKRMTREEVVMASKSTPLHVTANEFRDNWTVGGWLKAIEKAQAKATCDAELAAKQVELFK